MKYLDPRADLTFKKVFGEHPDLMISFLNAMLPLRDDEPVESIEYLSPEMIPPTPTNKFSIVDVRCRDRKEGFLQTAGSMKAMNLPTEIIVKITGLSAAEIEAL